MRFLWLLLPIAMAALRLKTKKYIFSALVTLTCAAIIPFGSGFMLLGLLLSVIGDYLLAHQKGHPNRFLFGVAFFALAHLAFILHAGTSVLWYRHFSFRPPALFFALALAALYAVYLTRRILPGQPAAMKIALSGYALVSLAGLYFALSMQTPGALEYWLYVAGIAAIVFSDTMIAEAEFAGRREAHKLILPTYYLCHILLAASLIACRYSMP